MLEEDLDSLLATDDESLHVSWFPATLFIAMVRSSSLLISTLVWLASR